MVNCITRDISLGGMAQLQERTTRFGLYFCNDQFTKKHRDSTKLLLIELTIDLISKRLNRVNTGTLGNNAKKDHAAHKSHTKYIHGKQNLHWCHWWNQVKFGRNVFRAFNSWLCNWHFLLFADELFKTWEVDCRYFSTSQEYWYTPWITHCGYIRQHYLYWLNVWKISS